MPPRLIRNFCIVAHIDHGKSTLADRMLEITGTVPAEKMRQQFLDQMDLERERGITIKLTPVRMNYKLQTTNYTLNLIDTPGHVDFSYEVSRSLAACEGAILLVDATQGIQAQTLANYQLAKKQNLKIIPVVNKIDSPLAKAEETARSICEIFGFSRDEIIFSSGKTGQGVKELLEKIIEKIPPPAGKTDEPLRALIFDSRFDEHKGVITYVRIFDGQTPGIGQGINFLGTRVSAEILEVGYFAPQMQKTDQLKTGEVGYIATGLKDVSLCRVGDTISNSNQTIPLPGYKIVKPMVFVGLYPVDNDDFLALGEALNKLKLSDSALNFAAESSNALGNGFRCGFLGLLHAEIVQERLEREYGLNLIAVAPTVEYLVNGRPLKNPADLPKKETIQSFQEPWVQATIFTPSSYLGNLMDLCQKRRGALKTMEYLGDQVRLIYEIPLSEIASDFYGELKSLSSGFASLDWDFLDYRDIDGVKLEILVAGHSVDALSKIVPAQFAQREGRQLIERLKNVIPRQNFEVALQASIGGKILARENIPPFRKDVIEKLYGGDRTRKDKLLEAQKKGKKRMKMVGRVQIPQEAFLSILKKD